MDILTLYSIRSVLMVILVDNNSVSDEDYSDDGDEGTDGYKPGGYHPVQTGEMYSNRYDHCYNTKGNNSNNNY